jgi:hypothetical protein
VVQTGIRFMMERRKEMSVVACQIIVGLSDHRPLQASHIF